MRAVLSNEIEQVSGGYWDYTHNIDPGAWLQQGGSVGLVLGAAAYVVLAFSPTPFGLITALSIGTGLGVGFQAVVNFLQYEGPYVPSATGYC